jgi:hypothetical protein
MALGRGAAAAVVMTPRLDWISADPAPLRSCRRSKVLPLNPDPLLPVNVSSVTIVRVACRRRVELDHARRPAS